MPHSPFAHVPFTTGHVVPDAMQVLFTQQPPPLHVFAAQHASPPPPHVSQIPVLQTAPLLQVSPVQQAWPAAPHAAASLPLLEPLLPPLLEPPSLLPLLEPELPPLPAPELLPLDPPLELALPLLEPLLLPPESAPLLLPSMDASVPPVPVALAPPQATKNAAATAIQRIPVKVFMTSSFVREWSGSAGLPCRAELALSLRF
jgi:hypothetical protein